MALLALRGSEASQLFCRYFVALTLNAAFERTTIDRTYWNPAYLVIDEFQLVTDEIKTPEMLRLAREYNLGITMAFQDIHGKPFNDNLRTAISTNTSIKYASSPEGVDLAYVARDLRCEPDFIRAQTKTATHARFGCFVRGYLDKPVSLTFPFGAISDLPHISDDAYSTFRERNRESLFAVTAEPPRAVESTEEETPRRTPSPSRKRRW